VKERLVEDWLTSINERGYEVPFSQSLLANGYKILRTGHSPTEHGKDVIAVSPAGAVCAYQLKTGDFGQAEVSKYLEQINMLVETRPIHPGLSGDFTYQPYLVTTGDFKQPALSLIKELNASWQNRRLPSLTPINGRQLHVDFVSLSSDFWPTDPPKIRNFRELYLANGRGDLNATQFARFLIEILRDAKSGLDLERRVSAANVFASYLLGEFYRQEDHWSVFQGWMICAAQIAWTGESREVDSNFWRKSLSLARSGSLGALRALSAEVLSQDGFVVRGREIDDYTRVRNTIAIAATACWQLVATELEHSSKTLQQALGQTTDLIHRGRLFVWSEGAFSCFLQLLWLLEKGGKLPEANSLLLELIEAVALQNCIDSEEPLADPYASPDECLVALLAGATGERGASGRAVNSYTLFSLVLLAVRRGLRAQLEKLWPQISRVTLKWFEPTRPVDNLLWHCPDGKECTGAFAQPQSWKELREIALRDRKNLLPETIKEDTDFAIMFLLAFPHRIAPAIVKYVDDITSAIAPSFKNP
jgi:hypothetical protein